MNNLEDLGEIISTDVLIVGGGVGGLVAALKVKEYPVDVLIVDKATVGWGGSGPKSGGGLSFIGPDDDPDKFVEYHVKNIGEYLNDQELLNAYARETYRAVQQFGEWGVKLARDDKGNLESRKHPLGLWSGTGIDIDMLLPIRARLRKMGAKILNKVSVVQLLKQGERIVGAVGFSLIDGRFYIIKAKATILANAGCTFQLARPWSPCTGSGIAAAYWAGAEMRNAEFSDSYGFRNMPPGSQGYIFNALGENISKRYMPGGLESDFGMGMILGVEKEIKEGRGPVYVDVSEVPDILTVPSSFSGMWLLPKNAELMRRQEAKGATHFYSNDLKSSMKREVAIRVHYGLSPVKVDHNMKTSLDGLWAIGDTSYQGSAWAGAVSAPPGRMRGSGLGNALFSALRGGPAAGGFAAKAASSEIDYTEVKRLKDEIFTPMRHSGGLLPWDATYAIQDVVGPAKYGLHRSKERLEEALLKIKQIQLRLQELWAKDSHELSKCHEVKSMAVCAEMAFRAALMRTESRGSHYREDYPKKDDRNWLKWVIIKQEAGNMALSTEAVPIENYKFKP